MSTVDIFQNEQKECGSEMYFSKMNPVDPFILRPSRGRWKTENESSIGLISFPHILYRLDFSHVNFLKAKKIKFENVHAIFINLPNYVI